MDEGGRDREKRMRMNLNRGGKSGLRIAAAVAALILPGLAKGAPYYWSGDQASSGTVNSPINGSWSSGSTANWYQDPTGATTYGVGVNPASANTTSVFFGGDSGTNSYKVSANAGITINNIVLQDAAAVSNTLDFTLTGSSKLSMAAPSSGGSPVGFQQTGSANWNFTNGGGATAPMRFSNSASVTGNGSGNITFSTPFATNGSAENFTVNETGGAVITFAVSNGSMVGAGKTWTIQNGIVDFQNSSAFGNTTGSAVSFTGGTVESTTGTTLGNYSGGITFGGNFVLGGPANWSMGSSPVTVASTANDRRKHGRNHRVRPSPAPLPARVESLWMLRARAN